MTTDDIDTMIASWAVERLARTLDIVTRHQRGQRQMFRPAGLLARLRAELGPVREPEGKRDLKAEFLR